MSGVKHKHFDPGSGGSAQVTAASTKLQVKACIQRFRSTKSQSLLFAIAISYYGSRQLTTNDSALYQKNNSGNLDKVMLLLSLSTR